jgi:hypothetical protein
MVKEVTGDMLQQQLQYGALKVSAKTVISSKVMSARLPT